MKKRMADILDLKDKSFVVYDELRFNSNNSYKTFQIMEEMNKKLDELLAEEMAENNFSYVVVTERCIVEPGETVEIKTNINELFPYAPNIEFTSKGKISTYGYLSFSLISSPEDGLKIVVTNNVPKEKTKLSGYLCNPTTTKFFDSGVYLIDKSTVIGIAGLKTKEKQYEDGYSKEQEERDTKAVKEFVKTPMFQHILDM